MDVDYHQALGNAIKEEIESRYLKIGKAKIDYH